MNMFRQIARFLLPCVFAPALLGGAPARFTQFEARQTHPVALTPDGRRLLALNTPDARLSVFDITGPGAVPVLIAEIPVGLEPVSVRARTDDEAWVVNEVSDTLSVVSLSGRAVVATLPCPDEPSDVVFASGRAFVSCARSGGVRVFDITNRVETGVIPLDGIEPRHLAASLDGTRVYVACLLSGNNTTVLPVSRAPAPPAPENPALPAAHRTALIVPAGDSRIPYAVLDHDVAEISATSPRLLRWFSGVGTGLFGLAPRPGSDELWVANTEALNLVRFEPALRGHFMDNRVTRIALASGDAEPLDLNPGIAGADPAVAHDTALAQPAALVFTADGSAAWVAAFGSDRVARLDARDGTVIARADLRPGAAAGSSASPSPGPVRGPRGLALHEGSGRLFVLNKLANTLAVIDTATAGVIAEIPVGSHDPTPAAIRAGRGLLFDARLSGNGSASCASCHLDADRDGLAWDLGDPAGSMLTVIGANLAAHDTRPQERLMHPMKGPMVTQTLRGIGPTNLLHWRGDRASVRDFNPTFRDLLGGPLRSDAEMDSLAAYLFTLRHHPNPNLRLDGTPPASFNGGDPVRGRARFEVHINHCGVCHVGREGTDNNVDDPRNVAGFQPLKTPSLATTYQRAVLDTRAGATNVAGFGLLHDGSGGRQILPTVHFYELDALGGRDFADVTAYVLCFDTGTAPAVGWNRTIAAGIPAPAGFEAEVATVETAAAGDARCDLVVRGRLQGEERRFRYDPALGKYLPDRLAAAPLTRGELLASLTREGDAVTFLGVPPGDGPRLGGDRDSDGILDGDESAALAVAAVDGGLDISLPAGEAGWLLESAREVSGPWLSVSPQPAPGAAFHRIPAGGSGGYFFRLRRVW